MMPRFLRKYEGGQTIVAAYSGTCQWIFHGIYPAKNKIWIVKFRCFIAPRSNKSKRHLLNGNWHWHWCYFCTRFLLCFVIIKSRTSITTLIYGKCKHLESRTNIFSYI